MVNFLIRYIQITPPKKNPHNNVGLYECVCERYRDRIGVGGWVYHKSVAYIQNSDILSSKRSKHEGG